MESKKLYYTMGEVSEMFCVAPSLIRYWEAHFSVIKPVRNKKGNRMFTPSDIENFKIIYHLVKERGMTLEGAQRTMKQNRKGFSRDAELLERLQHIRSMLLEVREELKEESLDFADSEKFARCTVEIEGEEEQERQEDAETQSQNHSSGEVIDHSTRNVNRTPDAESKELFSFYEQKLF